jgi:hypothetical protein
MNTVKQNILIALSICIASVVTNKLFAQIVYTDLNPDAIPGAMFALDLNNDGIQDFGIYYATGSQVVIQPLGLNAYLGQVQNTSGLPWALANGQNICDTSTIWLDSLKPGTLVQSTTLGYWVGATDKYMGLKLVVGGNTYYGWVRMDILFSGASFAVKDYAYESTPNTCIAAGAGTLGINNIINEDEVNVYPHPFSSSTTITTTRDLQDATISLTDYTGKLVKSSKNIYGKQIEIDRKQLPNGIYFLKIKEKGKVVAVKKVVVVD